MPRDSSQILEEILILQAQAGRLDAWEQVIRRWQPRLMARAMQQLGHAEGAGDVVQETWLAVTRHLDRLDDPSRFGGWILQILSHKTVDWVRRRQLQRKVQQGFAEPDAQAVDAKTEASSDQQEQLELVRWGLTQLGSGQRELLTLFYLQERSIRQIAEELGVPEGTVKSRLHTAREYLKEILLKAQQVETLSGKDRR